MRRLASRLILPLAAAAALAGSPALASKVSDAEAAFAAGRDDEAMALYTAALAEAPDDAARAAAYFGRGEVHSLNRRVDEALADFSAVIALPNADAATRANAYFSRAEVASRRRMWEPALADYDAALKLQPKMLGVNIGRARALRGLDRKDEALAAFDAELKLNPTSYRAQVGKAELLGLPIPEGHNRTN